MGDATYEESDGDANWIEISDTISLADMVDFTDTLPANFALFGYFRMHLPVVL